MDKIWLKSYPPGVPHDVDPEQYSSLTDLLERSFREHADNPFSVCMDRWMSYRQLEQHSAALPIASSAALMTPPWMRL